MKLTAKEQATVQRALAILEKNMRVHGVAMTSPTAVRDFLRLRLAAERQEVFVVLFLDAQHRVIEAVDMFRGTLTQTSVYPREVIRAALEYNAAAVILAHNHPSGVAIPSQADEFLTRNLRDGLALVDVSVLDHFIVAGMQALSFAERGLLQSLPMYRVA